MTNLLLKKIGDDQQEAADNARDLCVKTYGDRSLYVMSTPIYNETAQSNIYQQKYFYKDYFLYRFHVFGLLGRDSVLAR